MNFYTWVREGVKRAVLLGFSDAIEQVGVPHENDEAGHQLLAILKQAKTLDNPERPAPTAAAGRKRLGRSLDEIVKNPAPTAQ